MDEKEVSEMQEEMMTVLVVEPMKAPYVKNIPNELEDLQQAVGGDIEMTYPFDDKVGILLNGNGKFEGLPLNRALYDDRGQVYDAIAGTFLVVGLTEDDFTSLTPEQIEEVFRKLNLIFEFADFSPAVLERAVNMKWKDFEDAVQSATAESIHADYIITRNLKDFTQSRVMAFTPTELLARI